VELIDKRGLLDKICREWFVLEQIVSDELLYVEGMIVNKLIEENARSLLNEDINTLSCDKWGYAKYCIRYLSVDGKQCIKQYLLLQKEANDYIAISDTKGTKVYAYSTRKMMELFNNDLEGLE
jgi:hypothetical protein